MCSGFIEGWPAELHFNSFLAMSWNCKSIYWLLINLGDELTNDEQIRLRFQELDALEERRLCAVQNLELYRQNMVRAYDKLVKQ